MKKLNDQQNPENQGVNFLTGESALLAKGGGSGSDSAQKRLRQQRRKIQQARNVSRQERISSRNQLQRTNKQLRASASQNRGLLENLIGNDIPETEFIDDTEELSPTNLFGLAQTRKARFGLGNSGKARRVTGRRQLG